MMFRTHILFALCLYILATVIFSIGFSITLALALCFGTIIPDIDSPKSFVNKKFLFGIGKTVAAFSKHRGFFHSIFGMITFFIATFLIMHFFHIPLIYSIVFSAGYFLHLLADSFTVSGVKWFWKSNFRTKGIIKTASFGENIFFIILLVAIFFLIIGKPGLQEVTGFVSNIKL